MDGVTRKDFGVVIHKEDLPITKVTVRDVGDDKIARYNVGWLKCAPTQFGIEPSCQDYRYKNRTYSYTYLIDPDGPVYPHTSYPRDLNIDNKDEFYSTNIAPFPVHCKFPAEPQIGITVIPTDQNKMPNDTQHVALSYLNVDRLMIMKLVTRSSYCLQTIQYDCDLRQSASYWTSRWDNSDQFYINATDSLSCDKQLYNTVQLHDKQSIPVTDLWITDSKKTPTVGALQCYETYANCYSLYVDGFTVYGQYKDRLDVTHFVIDPDDTFGVEPFLVGCEFPLKTILYPEYGSVDTVDDPQYHGPHAACTNFTYLFADSNQIQALVDVSGFCMQYMSYSCQYSPISSHVYWISHKGQKMAG
ncbi:hypothetical protein LSH36_662g04065 [Paralvinella palmiformis]|uniref:Uncharacterized protein n=1 Tax=Paralvinella palmiformis TaxID=53620 RepID=A0AAD9MUB2_9ANNE|nr:hypothetical protein LSH36_662g04065 [Paralvinella palmiformis]